MNGLSQITIEAFFLWTPGPSQYTSYIISSDGSVGDYAENSWNNKAFALSVTGSATGNGVLSAEININNISYSLTDSNPILANTVYHVALQFDGSAVRLYVNGVEVGSHSASGTLTQSADEDILLGGHTEGWPDLGSSSEHWLGNIDSVRISNVARYSGNFSVPGSKLTADGSTILLLNFVDWRDALVKADYCIGTDNAWLVVRNYGLVFGSPQTVQQMTLFGGSMGIMSVMSPQSIFQNLQVSGSGFVGVKLFNNDFLTRLIDINIIPARYAEAAIEGERQAGDLFISSLHTDSGYFGVVLNEGSAYLEQPFVAPSDLTMGAIVLKQQTLFSDVTLSQPMIDTENGGSPVPLTFVGDGEYMVLGGDLEAGSQAPAIRLIPNQMRNVIFYGTHAEVTNPTPATVDFEGPNTDTIVSKVLWFSPIVNGQSFARSSVSNSRRLIRLINNAKPLPTPAP